MTVLMASSQTPVREQQRTTSERPVVREETRDTAPILVTGAHRSGTTWVGKMLAATRQTAYISEPLNVLHRPAVFAAPISHWYTYIHTGNEAQYLPAYRKLLRLEYGLGRELAALRSRKDVLRMGRDAWIFWTGRINRARPLVKDPFAVFSIPWFVERLGMQVVVTVRHPAAFASSLMRLEWPFQLADLLGQPALMHDWLEPYRVEMEALRSQPDDILPQACLLWKMVYGAVMAVQACEPQVRVVRHEDLSRAPLEEFARLYHALGLGFSAKAQKAVQASSSPDNPAELSRAAVHTVQLDSRANLDNWKKRLSPHEVDRIRQLVGDAADKYYPDGTWY
jgi:hypothetical protein